MSLGNTIERQTITDIRRAVGEGTSVACCSLMRGFAALFGSAFFVTSGIAQTPAQISDLTQKLEGTIYVTPLRETAEGVLTGCGLEFAAMKRDFIASQGAPVKIVGSFYLRPSKNGGLGYSLKLSVFDGFVSKAGFAPNNGFISAPNGKIPAKAKRVAADTPGFSLFFGALDDAVIDAYSSIVEKSKLTVGFNKKPGQLDVTFLVDLTVVDTKMGENGELVRLRSAEPVDAFMSCSGALLGEIKKPTR